jgi:hypothetical protein
LSHCIIAIGWVDWIDCLIICEMLVKQACGLIPDKEFHLLHSNNKMIYYRVWAGRLAGCPPLFDQADQIKGFGMASESIIANGSVSDEIQQAI